jgi:hypothetical protein
MIRVPFIVIDDGKAYRWKDILELRRAQLAAAEAAQGSQLALRHLERLPRNSGARLFRFWGKRTRCTMTVVAFPACAVREA